MIVKEESDEAGRDSNISSDEKSSCDDDSHDDKDSQEKKEGEEEDNESNADDKMELQNLMKNLQHFASLSATVPDAKYSKTREQNLMKDLQEELTE